MTASALVVLAAFLLENRDLGCTFMTGDARRYSRATNRRAPDFRLIVTAQQQNIQLDGFADFLVDGRHSHGRAFCNAKLLAASPDDRV